MLLANKSITFAAPKLYHIILGRVKLFLITYFLCVFKKQLHNLNFSAIINFLNRKAEKCKR